MATGYKMNKSSKDRGLGQEADQQADYDPRRGALAVDRQDRPIDLRADVERHAQLARLRVGTAQPEMPGDEDAARQEHARQVTLRFTCHRGDERRNASGSFTLSANQQESPIFLRGAVPNRLGEWI